MDDLVCSVEEGKLKGQSRIDINGTPFVSFMGVPFAQAPIGKLRFKAPQPPEKWNGIREATKEGPPCYSLQFIPKEEGLDMKVMGSEDCLFLNIFTRKLFKKGSNLRPVMVFIHGGAFFTGSSDQSLLGPEFLMTEDIVLVTIQYRLGALGFLVIDDPSLNVTGNAGLKDQLQALQWVQKNIKQFNGDPNNVTVFGHSAGAASVHYLILSPLAKGLFHKAILQSGSALCPWTRGVNSAENLAQTLGFQENNSEKILEFLQDVPVEKLLEAQNLNQSLTLDPTKKRSFAPTVERTTPNAFLNEEPLDILNSGTYNHVPLMIGYTSQEGIIDAHVEDTGLGGNRTEFIPYYFGFEKNSEEYVEVNKKILKFYFGTEKPSFVKDEPFYNVLTDTIFVNGIYRALKAHVKTSQSPVYFYRMSLDTSLNLFKKMTKSKAEGVCHGDDLSYLFKDENVLKLEGIEKKSVFRFVKMWTNFAKTGNPVPAPDSLLDCEWKPVTKEVLNFLDIGAKLIPGTDPDFQRMQFWNKLTKDVTFRY